MINVQKFTDDSENVTKYVFTKENACYEAVLYRYPTYEERTVLCISTQCGCPVGCTFCGTGSNFVRNLTMNEIEEQVHYIFHDIGLISEYSEELEYVGAKVQSVKKLQIMFMSMGEPFLNYVETMGAVIKLADYYHKADLLVSTIGPHNEQGFKSFLQLSEITPKLGLQFSIHNGFDQKRNKLIPFENKMNLLQIRDYGIQWYAKTGRQVYLNYCIDGTNNRDKDLVRLLLLFPPSAFAFTFSVICSADETMKDAGYRQRDEIEKFERVFLENGYNTRIFDPAGQDSIGGGCGQLWYVQKWMEENK